MKSVTKQVAKVFSDEDESEDDVSDGIEKISLTSVEGMLKDWEDLHKVDKPTADDLEFIASSDESPAANDDDFELREEEEADEASQSEVNKEDESEEAMNSKSSEKEDPQSSRSDRNGQSKEVSRDENSNGKP